MSTTNNKVALVTGASTGIGRAIADELAARGHRVFGTSRSQRSATTGIDMRVMEVADDASVDSCVAGILADAGHIDIVVNNAAKTIVAPAEELPLDKAAEMMDVNFYGAARVVNAVLPSMRSNGGGQLIFISSLGGLMGIPGQSHYCSTKHALEGYVDGLALELAQFGISATLVEPGSFRTEIIETSERPSWPTIDVYDGYRERLRDVVTKATAEGGDPTKVARVVASIADKKQPKLRYRVDRDGKRAVMFKTLLPQKAFYGVLRKRFGG